VSSTVPAQSQQIDFICFYDKCNVFSDRSELDITYGFPADH